MAAPDLLPDERRSEPRVQAGNQPVLVALCDGRDPVTGWIWDLSKRGACLRLPPDVAASDSFKIFIEQRWRKAAVVWQRWPQIGIRFLG